MNPTNGVATDTPVFGFVLLGGTFTGALVRDFRLANELHARGYRVHVWWTIDRLQHPPLHPDIPQHWLFNCMRYFPLPFQRPFGLKDHPARWASWYSPDQCISRYYQKHPFLVDRLMRGILHRLCDGVEHDRGLLRRFGRQLSRHRVTHVFTTVAMLGQWVLDAQPFTTRAPRLLVTFHAYDLIANYARPLGLEQTFYQRLRDIVRRCEMPAIAVSAAYAARVVEEVGIPPESLCVIPPGVPIPESFDREAARRVLAAHFPDYRPDVPLVSYMGRLDAEKGLDLLLYAVSILRARDIPVQLAICGPSTHSATYGRACRLIAENLRLPVMWHDAVHGELREAVLAGSDAVVYPSIHCEPFGMVPLEAMSFGTPVVVPDRGGNAASVALDGHVGGLVFRSGDSGDLAHQLERVLTDRPLWNRLAQDAPVVASYYSVANMTDRILQHLGLPLKAHTP